jgi:hypothetical protein
MSLNGQLSPTELTLVQASGLIQLPNMAAAAFAQARAVGYDETGIVMRITTPYGGYRDLDAQRAMNANTGTSTSGVVAPVGYSVHGRGPGAVDIANRREFGDVIPVAGTGGMGDYSRRLDSIMARHGWRRTLSGEGWHYEFNGTYIPPAVTGEPDTEEDEENDMFKVITRIQGAPEWCLVAPHLSGPTAKERGYLVTTDETVGTAWARLYAKGSGNEHARVDRAGYIAIQDAARVQHEQWKASRAGA